MGGKHQRVVRRSLEIGVLPAEGAQPLILEMASAPGGHELATFARRNRLRGRQDRRRVEDGESIERDGANSRRRKERDTASQDTGRDESARRSYEFPSAQ
jgi:hypothetical protein